jgi:hypothetical protein
MHPGLGCAWNTFRADDVRTVVEQSQVQPMTAIGGVNLKCRADRRGPWLGAKARRHTPKRQLPDRGRQPNAAQFRTVQLNRFKMCGREIDIA